MSPLALDILLHYYTSASDYRDGDYSAPAVRELIDAFKGDLMLLEERPELERYKYGLYQLTQRGNVFVAHLCSIPLPIQVWVMPDNMGGRDDV